MHARMCMCMLCVVCLCVLCVCVCTCAGSVPQYLCQHQPSPQLCSLDPSPSDLLLDFSDVLQVGAWHSHVHSLHHSTGVETVREDCQVNLSVVVFPLLPPPPSLQVSVYALGRAYLKLSAALHINPPALGEPAGESHSSSVGRGVVYSLEVTAWCSEGDIASFVAALHCFSSLTYTHNKAHTASILFSLGSCMCCKCWTHVGCIALYRSRLCTGVKQHHLPWLSTLVYKMCTRCLGFSRSFRSRNYLHGIGGCCHFFSTLIPKPLLLTASSVRPVKVRLFCLIGMAPSASCGWSTWGSCKTNTVHTDDDDCI